MSVLAVLRGFASEERQHEAAAEWCLAVRRPVLEILDGELEIDRGHHDSSFDLSRVVV